MGRETLNLPVEPRWATDPNTTLEPETGRKDTGAVENQRMPAREFNWLQNANYEWTRRQQKSALSTMTYTSTIDTGYLVYRPTQDDWLMCSVIGLLPVFSTKSGQAWTEIGNMPETVLGVTVYGVQSIAAVGFTGTVFTSDDGATWAGYTSGALDPRAIAAAYPIDNRIMVADPNVIYYASSANGTWSPVYTSVSAGEFIKIEHLNGTNWAALKDTGEVVISTDNGSSWSIATALPNISQAGGIAFNQISGRLTVVGKDAISIDYTWYSDDLGTSWIQNPIYNSGAVSSDLPDISYGGNNLLVLSGRQFPSGNDVTGDFTLASVSNDDGITWTPIVVNDIQTTTPHTSAMSFTSDRMMLVKTSSGGLGLDAYVSSTV